MVSLCIPQAIPQQIGVFGDTMILTQEEIQEIWDELMAKGWDDDDIVAEVQKRNEEAENDPQRKLNQIRGLMDSPAYNALSKEAQKAIERDYNQFEIELNCTCDREYGEADPDCYTCLQIYRRNRMGFSVHNTDCMCNDCQYGAYGYPRADY